MLHRLLTCTATTTTDGDKEHVPFTLGWSDVVLQNLAVMLSSAIEQQRVGATLALLGGAQRAVLRVQFDSHCRVETGVASSIATATDTAAYDLQLAKTLQSWLLILDRNSRHYVKDHLIWGLLWGGILPLLYDAASLTLSRRVPVDNAVSTALAPTVPSHCVELGRLGLSALLSVLREESGYTNLFALTDDIGYLGTMGDLSDLDRNDKTSDGRALQKEQQQWHLAVSVHTAALTALGNLLVAAHAMMHRHAGKVVCELVAYHCKLLHVQGPTPDTNGASETTGYDQTAATANLESKSALFRHDISALQQLALHTASVAMMVCGEKAESILERIAAVDNKKNGHESNGTNESNNYDDHVLHTVTLIRRQAKAICSLRTAS